MRKNVLSFPPRIKPGGRRGGKRRGPAEGRRIELPRERMGDKSILLFN